MADHRLVVSTRRPSPRAALLLTLAAASGLWAALIAAATLLARH